jgi:hypothetical protein
MVGRRNLKRCISDNKAIKSKRDDDDLPLTDCCERTSLLAAGSRTQRRHTAWQSARLRNGDATLAARPLTRCIQRLSSSPSDRARSRGPAGSEDVKPRRRGCLWLVRQPTYTSCPMVLLCSVQTKFKRLSEILSFSLRKARRGAGD